MSLKKHVEEVLENLDIDIYYNTKNKDEETNEFRYLIPIETERSALSIIVVLDTQINTLHFAIPDIRTVSEELNDEELNALYRYLMELNQQKLLFGFIGLSKEKKHLDISFRHTVSLEDRLIGKEEIKDYFNYIGYLDEFLLPNFEKMLNEKGIDISLVSEELSMLMEEESIEAIESEELSMLIEKEPMEIKESMVIREHAE